MTQPTYRPSTASVAALASTIRNHRSWQQQAEATGQNLDHVVEDIIARDRARTVDRVHASLAAAASIVSVDEEVTAGLNVGGQVVTPGDEATIVLAASLHILRLLVTLDNSESGGFVSGQELVTETRFPPILMLAILDELVHHDLALSFDLGEEGEPITLDNKFTRGELHPFELELMPLRAIWRRYSDDEETSDAFFKVYDQMKKTWEQRTDPCTANL